MNKKTCKKCRWSIYILPSAYAGYSPGFVYGYACKHPEHITVENDYIDPIIFYPRCRDYNKNGECHRWEKRKWWQIFRVF